tara:strand:+ start:3752 stop:3856 length:105 start_codon:yes stop_codon:yes gene_type:complete
VWHHRSVEADKMDAYWKELFGTEEWIANQEYDWE